MTSDPWDKGSPGAGPARHESVVSMCQRKNTESVADVRSVGDAGEQPLDLILVNTLREEGNNLEELPGIGTEFLEHG